MEQSRRDFIAKALYGIAALFGLGGLFGSLRALAPVREPAKELVWLPLVSEDAVPRRGVKKAELRYVIAGKERKVPVFILSSPQGLGVLSAVCSHLGCLVTYHKEKKEFICPCHGGRYDSTGNNIAGPPPAPLTALPVKIEQGMVLVGVKV